MNIQKTTYKEAGISASCVLDFVNEIKDICMHGFIMLRNGRVFSKMSYHSITPDTPQRLYSVSKTFTGAAIGMLIYEGKLSLDDKIIDHFGKKSEYKWVNDMTIRDCLMMATCHNGTTYKVTDKEWVETFFNTKPTHPSGTVYHYDTSSSHTLSALVERITGMRLMEYLRLKMNLSDGVDCVKGPDGYSWGGSGVIANLYDMAKLGLLYMNGGTLDGVRLMSEEYAKESTTKQIDNDSGFNHRWTKGYGYQIWMTEYGYAFFGAGSQDVICVPDKDFIFVCTADNLGDGNNGVRLEKALVNNIINKLDVVTETDLEAEAKLAEMKPDLPHVIGVKEHLDGKGRYKLEENPMGIDRIELDCESGVLIYNTPRGEKRLEFGMDGYKDSLFPETHYFGRQIGTSGNYKYKCTSMGAWTEYNKFEIKTWILDDHTGGVYFTLVFKGDEISVCFRKHGEWYLDEYNGFAGGSAE